MEPIRHGRTRLLIRLHAEELRSRQTCFPSQRRPDRERPLGRPDANRTSLRHSPDDERPVELLVGTGEDPRIRQDRPAREASRSRERCRQMVLPAA